MSKLKAIMTVGCSAAGKNTWVDEFLNYEKLCADLGEAHDEWVVIERDVIRFTDIVKNNGEKDWTKYKFTRARENRVTEIQDKMIEDAVENNQNIIICETNLNPKNRKKMVHNLSSLGFEVIFKEFEASLDELWKRDAQRSGGVGHFVIWKQWLQWLDYKGQWKYTPDQSLPKAIALDVDGSLAHMVSRGPFEWNKVDQDEPIQVNIDFAKGMESQGYQLIVFSGRDGSCKEKTSQWLTDHGIHFADIYMREAGDMRKDYIIKEEILKEAAEKYNVVGVLDDRGQVTRKWVELGLHCWNVGDPNDNF